MSPEGLEADDAAIAQAVAHEMFVDHLTPNFDIDISSRGGRVELTGTVDNLLAKRRATWITEAVKGVRGVDNRIEITAEPVTDAQLTADVMAALHSDAASKNYPLKAVVHKGEVALEGDVPSWAAKQIAEEVASSVPGVTDIDNWLMVQYEPRTDAEVATEIARRLADDVLIDDSQIEVTVTDGHVLLSGLVGSASQRARVVSRAWTAGVKSVEYDDLLVDQAATDADMKSTAYVLRSPDEISAAVAYALLQNPQLEGYYIQPVVEGTTVTLYGIVDDNDDKDAAEQVARNTIGVTHVVDEIRIEPTGELADDAVARAISERLLSNVYIDQGDIDVSVDNGVATLTGTIDSYFDKAQATAVANRARGVVYVRNLLRVQHSGQATTTARRP